MCGCMAGLQLAARQAPVFSTVLCATGQDMLLLLLLASDLGYPACLSSQ